MKLIRSILVFILFPFISLAQDSQYFDSLNYALQHTDNDTIKMDIYRNMGFYLQNGKVDSALYFHQKQLAYAEKLSMKLYEADAHEQIAYALLWQNNLPEALKNYNQALKIASDPTSGAISWGHQNFSFSKSPEDARLSIIGMVHYELATLYRTSKMDNKDLDELNKAITIGKKLDNLKILALSTRDIGSVFLNKHQPDSALKYFRKAVFYYKNGPYRLGIGSNYQYMGETYIIKQQYDSAKVYLNEAKEATIIYNDLLSLCVIYLDFGKVYLLANQTDSATYYTEKGILLSRSIKSDINEANGYIQLSTIHQLLNKPYEALENLQKGKSIGDSINNAYINKLIQLQNAGFDEQFRLKKIADDQASFQNRLKMISLIVVIGVFLLIALLLYRNNRNKQKANTVLEKTLSDLKSTQAQLIQSEKMASLGELTAGIAHEIQNPLNFVNNFSEVNTELIGEMKAELAIGNMQLAIELANDIEANEEKINHHGKRADAIVKGMLQHSRSSNGVKEPTDINALCDEYLRLSYHGLRAKDKSFNATIKTDFDASLEKLNIIPQDIGRVVLNLLTNAFYVVDEKKKTATEVTPFEKVSPLPFEKVSPLYEPTVFISTKKVSDKVEISVSDNGNGIPQKILDKIFQPFFTTKPTGQGTGLGLSLSYDIVKAHSGKLKVETEEGQGTTFIISLPININ